MTARSGIVTLTTDFGSRDPYAAALEAALLKSWSSVRVMQLDLAAADRIRVGTWGDEQPDG